MKSLIAVVILLLFSLHLSGQWGVRIGYNLNKTPAWDDFFSTVENRNQDVFESSLGFEVDYWTRLKNHRIEFYPYLSYHQATSDLAVSQTGLKLRQLGAGVKTHIYLLDLLGDCDCPTFSKQGGLVKKGLFFLAGVGVDYSQKSIGPESFRDGNIDVRGSIGLGLDLGINDLITISPFVVFQRYFDVSWHELGVSFGQPDRNVSSHINQLQLGIRVGFRPDYDRPRF